MAATRLANVRKYARAWTACINRHPLAAVQADLEAFFLSHSGALSLRKIGVQAAVLQGEQKLACTTFTCMRQWHELVLHPNRFENTGGLLGVL